MLRTKKFSIEGKGGTFKQMRNKQYRRVAEV